jgi:hypothetical protein
MPKKQDEVGGGQHHGDTMAQNIRQQEAKIEGLMKKKYSQDFPEIQVLKTEGADSRVRPHFPTKASSEEVLTEQMLRGSCQNVLKKFDYASLRNTTNFNPIEKRNPQHELRRSPQEDHKHMQFNKSMTGDLSPGYLRP